MTSFGRPPWLVRQENGTIAEARTKAFLLDQFWILERSVDVEGADFIVQPRLTARSLLDRKPPKLGFVQTKYYQSEQTTQYMHKEYVLTDDGQARPDFFLICHSGLADSAKAYFLTSSDIVADFALTGQHHSKPERFALPGRALLQPRYEILNRTRVLKLIEAALHATEFLQNRRFMSWAMPSMDGSMPPIRTEYLEDIDNHWGDIPTEFNKIRDRAKSALFELEEAADILNDIVTSDDPEFALEKAETLHYLHGAAVRLPDDLWSDEFFSVVQEHKLRYEQLNSEGLLGTFAAARRAIKDRVVSDLESKMPLSRDAAYVLDVNYDESSFGSLALRSNLRMVAELSLPMSSFAHQGERLPEPVGVLSSSPGHVMAYVIPGRWSYERWSNRKLVADHREWSEKLAPVAHIVVRYIAEEMLVNRFDLPEEE